MPDLIKTIFQSKLISIQGQGESMSPLIRSDDLIFVNKVKYSNIKINNIVAINKNNNLIAHRVVYKNSRYLVTKGDNNILSDGRISKKQILGKVSHLKRKGKLINIDYLYLLQSSIYFKEIVRINKLLIKSKIENVYLKSLPLYLFYLKSHPSRFYADCDLLIRKKDLIKISKLLIKEKYTLQESSYSPIHKLLKDKPTEYVFVKNNNNFIVRFDIHLEANFLLNQIGRLNILYPQKFIDKLSDQFLQEIKTISLNKETYAVLSDVNLILYLSLHFFHHNYKGAFRLDLIDKLIKLFKTFDWRILQKKIKYYRLENYVYPVFILLQKYYKTPIRNKFYIAIKPDDSTLMFIKKEILNTNIFDEESNFRAGIRRFKYIFYLSPQKKYFKYLVFLYPSVIWSILWVSYKTTFTFWKRKRFYF